MSSNRPELVDLRECWETHQDHENLLYLTDSEDTLQVINKWIGGGTKFRLLRSPDEDVLKTIKDYHHKTAEVSITVTYTADWLLRQGEYWRKLGDWLKENSVNSQDQRRILKVISNTFPSNVWIHRITKGKESNKWDLWKDLRIKENHFTTQVSWNRIWVISNTLVKSWERFIQQSTTDDDVWSMGNYQDCPPLNGDSCVSRERKT